MVTVGVKVASELDIVKYPEVHKGTGQHQNKAEHLGYTGNILEIYWEYFGTRAELYWNYTGATVGIYCI